MTGRPISGSNAQVLRLPSSDPISALIVDHVRRIFPSRNNSDLYAIKLHTDRAGAIDVQRGITYPLYHAFIQAFPHCGGDLVVGEVRYPVLVVGPNALSIAEAYRNLLGLLASMPPQEAGVYGRTQPGRV